MGLGSILMISFKFNYLYKDLIYENIHILRSWRLGLQCMNFGGDIIQPIRTVISMPQFGKHFNVNVISGSSEFG